MADDNEKKPSATPGAEGPEKANASEGADKTARQAREAKDGAAKDGAAKDGAAKDGAAKDGAAKDGAANASASGKADDGQKSKAFELLDKAIKATDWAWKQKSGVDRELARATYLNAEKAWVAAAVEDPKQATAVWRKATNRQPSSEMEQSLAAALKNKAESGKSQEGPSGGNLDTLAADMGELSKRRDLSESKTRKTQLSSSLGEWNIMRGDSQQRALQAKRARSNELWTPEPDKNHDGLHLLKSFVKGFATHRESAQKRMEKKKARMAGDAIKDIDRQIGKISTSIKKFETELNVPMDQRESLGVVGRSRKALSQSRTIQIGATSARIMAKVSKTVADKTGVTKASKKTGEFARDLAKGVAIQSAAAFANPGAIDGNPGKASYESRMAAFHQFQRTRPGMGPS